MTPNIHHGVILIVDDNLTNLRLFSEILVQSGFTIDVANDGQTALEKATQAQPDLILLDVMMPGIDGFETCKKLKANPLTRNISIIFMTALSDTLDKVKGLSLGAVDYISKPCQPEELLARVKVHLQIHFLGQQLESQNRLLKQEINERTAAEEALQELNHQLEERVKARTEALSRSLQELQEAQLQIVKSEKLASLGQLLAGVAHELNNPVCFISNNLKYAEEYTGNLVKMLESYHRYSEHRQESEIKNLAQELDIDFIIEDLPKIIDSMKLGTERIKNLSISLRNFSRADTDLKVLMDIHEGLDSTLLILNHRLKANNKFPGIQILKSYGELPLLSCYPNQMNQVFMNILANAVDALEELAATEPQTENLTIRVATKCVQGRVVICIKDNAHGLTEEAKKRLFEPTFTTKPMGKGTGLGLSISRQIVEDKHQGILTCCSQPNQGTEFRIEIPLS